MKFNFNGTQSLIVCLVAASTGAVIFGITKAAGVISSKRAKKDPEAETAEETEPEETEDSE